MEKMITERAQSLNVSDLSVGDWVRVINQFNAQIDGYHSGSGSLSLKTRQGNLVYYRLEDIRPIPITAEILEKNGLFRHERDADNPELIVLSNHFIMARTYTDVDWWRVLIYDEELPSVELFNGIIYSVHQLQHALRLARVDKEINL